MPGPILVINAGSSSLKFSVFSRSENDWVSTLRGQIDGIGTSPRFKATLASGEIVLDRALSSREVPDPRSAMDTVGVFLASQLSGQTIAAAGHRVVHGGAKYSHPVLLDRAIYAELLEFVPLAPLHQPHNLAVVDRLLESMPDVPQVACFDTAFHRGRALVTEIFPLPWDLYESGVRRYGFHGSSYEYIASVLPQVAPEIARGRVVVAHLGSGASLCAIRDLRCVDTTLSFTPLDGLCMGTRPGAIDPGVVLYLFENRGLSAAEAGTILYKKSGLLGISGISNDMRDLLQSPDPRAALAIDYFVYRAAKDIAALASVLGGLDALVFTAGIGENSPEIRRRICHACAWLGLALDEDSNQRHATRISAQSSSVAAFVIPTNEELMIARHTARLLA